MAEVYRFYKIGKKVDEALSMLALLDNKNIWGNDVTEEAREGIEFYESLKERAKNGTVILEEREFELMEKYESVISSCYPGNTKEVIRESDLREIS